MMTLDDRLKSKWWRINHLYKIRDKAGQLVTFKPNQVQLKHLIDRGAHRRNLILKARQFGFTTLYCIDLLDDALWIPGMTCGIIAYEAKKLPDFFQIVKRAYINLPERIKPMTKTDTKYMYEFVEMYNGIPLDSSVYVSTDIRGGTVQNLHVTESAYVRDRAKLNAGSKQAVPISGRISEETTGNGYNEFFDFFMAEHTKPNKGEMDYMTHFYPWIDNMEYTLPGSIDEFTRDELEIKRIVRETYKKEMTDGQLLWRRWKLSELKSAQVGTGLNTLQLFKQEYPLTISEAFQSGAGNVFDAILLDDIVPPIALEYTESVSTFGEDKEDKRSQFERLFKLGVKFWELPKLGIAYDIGVDPSDGLGSDFSCIDVWERDNITQVAQFYGKVRPDELAEIAADIGRFYNEAFIGVENNMLSTILFLSKIYDNYYYETKIDEKTQKRTKKLGWSTNTKTRDVMIDDFIILFEEKNITIRSPITLSEMRTFVKKEGGKREHADGKHDDALFGGFIAVQMRKFDRPRARAFTNRVTL